MRRILLTNDDGVDSPALVPLATALTDLGEVMVVVPDRERSWVAKAITRFDPVTVDEVKRDGTPMFTTSGFPADATQLGIHALGAPPPELVVSGINLGYNHGAGFLMSSGTVGAAVEGWISGIPSIAVSAGTMGDWSEWRRAAEAPESRPVWDRLAQVTVALIQDIEGAGLTTLADVVSINLPFGAGPDTPRRITSIARVGYDRLFSPRGDDTYVHAYGGGIRHIEAVEGSDIDAAHDGAISVTLIRMPESVPVPNSLRAAFER